MTILIDTQDPFDRMIIAQALEAGIPVMSDDGLFTYYPIKLI